MPIAIFFGNIAISLKPQLLRIHAKHLRKTIHGKFTEFNSQPVQIPHGEMWNIYYICMSVYMHNKLLSFDKSAFKSDSSLGRLNVYLKKLFHFTSLILNSDYFHKILPFYLKWLVLKWKSIVRMHLHTNGSISFANEHSVAANMK